MSTAPEGRSRFARLRKVARWIVAGAGALIVLLVSLALGIFYWNLDVRFGTLQEMPLEGSAEIIDTFAGNWYEQEIIPRARIRGGERPSLAFRMGDGCKLSKARVEEQGLVFDFSCSWGSGSRGLRFVAPGEVLWSEPGARRSGCDNCTPTLTRPSAWAWIGAWAGVFRSLSSQLVEDAFNACELWFVRHL